MCVLPTHSTMLYDWLGGSCILPIFLNWNWTCSKRDKVVAIYCRWCNYVFDHPSAYRPKQSITTYYNHLLWRLGINVLQSWLWHTCATCQVHVCYTIHYTDLFSQGGFIFIYSSISQHFLPVSICHFNSETAILGTAPSPAHTCLPILNNQSSRYACAI